jgi:hypothetical protein
LGAAEDGSKCFIPCYQRAGQIIAALGSLDLVGLSRIEANSKA